MTRLPVSSVDAQTPELRSQARLNDLEVRLATIEHSAQPGVEASFGGQFISTYMDYTTPAGNYTPPVNSYGLCGWYATVVVGPNQIWDVRGNAELQTTSATWIRTVAQHTIRDGAGAAGPSGVIVTNQLFTAYSNSAGPVLPVITTWGTMFTDATVAPNTTVRLHLQFNNVSGAGPVVVRDGNFYGITARRVV